jgi:hypothetical protein
MTNNAFRTSPRVWGGGLGVVALAVVAVTSLAPPSATAETSRATVTVTGPASDPMTGASFAISGTVSPSTRGQAVRLQREVDGRFRRVGTTAVSADGSYLFTRTQKVGSYVYRVKVPRSASAAAAISPTVPVFVTTHFIRRAVVRAQSWVDAHVPYSQSSTHTNRYGTYRQDCSGYVSLAWALPSSYTTATLPGVSFAISQTDLRRGDLLLHLATHKISGHVVMFDAWADAAHTSYVAYEETPSGGASHHVIPYPYWSGHGSYVPYRRDGT